MANYLHVTSTDQRNKNHIYLATPSLIQNDHTPSSLLRRKLINNNIYHLMPEQNLTPTITTPAKLIHKFTPTTPRQASLRHSMSIVNREDQHLMNPKYLLSSDSHNESNFPKTRPLVSLEIATPEVSSTRPKFNFRYKYDTSVKSSSSPNKLSNLLKQETTKFNTNSQHSLNFTPIQDNVQSEECYSDADNITHLPFPTTLQNNSINASHSTSASSSHSSPRSYSNCSLEHNLGEPTLPLKEEQVHDSSYSLDKITFNVLDTAHTDIFPCTLHQKYILTYYPQKNIVRGFLLHGPVNRAPLEEALNRTAKLHPLLFSRVIGAETDDPTFRIAPVQSRSTLSLEHTSINTVKPSALIQMASNTLFNYKHESSDKSSGDSTPPLCRAWIYTLGHHEHTLVISISAIICDFYSASLFIRQLCSLYANVVSSSKIVKRIPSIATTFTTRNVRHTSKSTFLPNLTNKLKKPITDTTLKSSLTNNYLKCDKLVNVHTSSIHFSQVAFRESEILSSTKYKDAICYWRNYLQANLESNRMVSHIRVPLSFSKEGKSAVIKPRLRSALQKSATSNKTSDFLFLKIDSEMAGTFFDTMEIKNHNIPERDMTCVLILATYSLILSVYFKGLSENILTSCVAAQGATSAVSRNSVADIVKQSSLLFNHDKINLKYSNSKDTRHRSDPYQFMIGVSQSPRYINSALCSLFGPLTYLSYFVVDLTNCYTFYDFLISTAKNLAFSLNYSYIPLPKIRESFDLRHPEIQFSFLHSEEMRQLTSPSEFFFAEASLGVHEHGLSRLGPSCFLSPLNSKFDRSCTLELVVWENLDNCSLGGGFYFDPNKISKSVIQELRDKLIGTLNLVVGDLDITVLDVVKKLTERTM